MKRFLLTFVLVLVAVSAHSQGTFFYNNPFAQTRLGSLDGALAQTNILAQMLVGATPGSLSPLGPITRTITEVCWVV